MFLLYCSLYLRAMVLFKFVFTMHLIQSVVHVSLARTGFLVRRMFGKTANC
jgi:hypothetical protein